MKLLREERLGLLHLRGSELVADGLTKPLLGQAFAAFLRDLGMPRQHENEEGEETHSQSAAVMAMIAGGLLLSGVDAEEEITGDTTSEVIWTCGAVLMALGAIYAGKRDAA